MMIRTTTVTVAAKTLTIIVTVIVIKPTHHCGCNSGSGPATLQAQPPVLEATGGRSASVASHPMVDPAWTEAGKVAAQGQHPAPEFQPHPDGRRQAPLGGTSRCRVYTARTGGQTAAEGRQSGHRRTRDLGTLGPDGVSAASHPASNLKIRASPSGTHTAALPLR